MSGLIDGGPPSKKARPCSSQGHHRLSGLNPAWHKQHPWLLYNNQEKAMYCQLCMKYGKLPRNGSGKWVQVGVTLLRQDKIRRHECSLMHRDAQRCKREENEARVTGGIRGVIEAGMTRERKAVIGALKCLYFLAKNKLPHTTKFATLLDLAINLGCDYMKELRRGGNASYRSEQTVSEFLFSLSDCIKQDILTKMHKSSTISIMTDESTDIAILKQLVVYGRAVVDGKLECHFLGIRDIVDGRAATIKKCILDFLHDTRFDINNVSSFGSDGASDGLQGRSGYSTQVP